MENLQWLARVHSKCTPRSGTRRARLGMSGERWCVKRESLLPFLRGFFGRFFPVDFLAVFFSPSLGPSGGFLAAAAASGRPLGGRLRGLGSRFEGGSARPRDARRRNGSPSPSPAPAMAIAHASTSTTSDTRRVRELSVNGITCTCGMFGAKEDIASPVRRISTSCPHAGARSARWARRVRGAVVVERVDHHDRSSRARA